MTIIVLTTSVFIEITSTISEEATLFDGSLEWKEVDGQYASLSYPHQTQTHTSISAPPRAVWTGRARDKLAKVTRQAAVVSTAENFIVWLSGVG